MLFLFDGNIDKGLSPFILVLILFVVMSFVLLIAPGNLVQGVAQRNKK